MMRNWMTVGALMVVLALMLAACAEGPEPATYNVAGVDYAFEGVPETVAAGSDFTLTNESAVEVHEIVLVRLPDGEDRSVEELLQLPPDDLMPLMMPGLVGVSAAPPLAEGMVVHGTMTVNEPGRYAMLCFIPTGADPDEFMAAAAAAEGDGPPDVPGGPPHTVHGMFAQFTVQ
jgi:hypothetical protein